MCVVRNIGTKQFRSKIRGGFIDVTHQVDGEWFLVDSAWTVVRKVKMNHSRICLEESAHHVNMSLAKCLCKKSSLLTHFTVSTLNRIT